MIRFRPRWLWLAGLTGCTPSPAVLAAPRAADVLDAATLTETAKISFDSNPGGVDIPTK